LWQQWSVQIVGHDDPRKASAAQRPGCPRFQVAGDDFHARIGHRAQCSDVTINSHDRMAVAAQEMGMSSAAGGKVEDAPGRIDPGAVLNHPGRRRRRGFNWQQITLFC
jgi:hypothetical protein